MNTINSRPGTVLADVQLIQTPEIPETYDWIHAIAFDTNGHAYQAHQTQEQKGTSSSTRAFGFGSKSVVHPTKVNIVFEIPDGTELRSVNVPQKVNLAGIGS